MLDAQRKVIRKSAALLLMTLLTGATLLPGVVAKAQQQPPTPQLISVFPAGGRAGTTFDLKIVEQTELEFAERLVFSHPGITAKPKLRETSRFYPNPTPLRNAFAVTISDDVPPGIYDVRGVCEYGVSNPRRFEVSEAEEFLEVEPNDDRKSATPVKINSAVNGVFESGYDYFKFTAKPNDTILVRCVSEQLDSQGDPVVTVFGPNGKIIGKNHDTTGRDALVSFIADQSGEYYARVHDLTFVSQRGQGTTPYRVSITTTPWIDFVDPPVLQAGTAAKVKLYGRNLNGALSGLKRNGQELEVIEVTVNPPSRIDATDFTSHHLQPNQFYGHRFAYRHKNNKGISNPILIDLSDRPVQREEDFRASKTELPSSDLAKKGVEMLCQFSTPGEKDEYRFRATAGQRIWIEIISQRIGVDSDPVMIIQSIQKDKEGNEVFRTVLTVDDFQPLASPFRIRLETEDPAVLFEAKNDGEYRMLVSDQFNLPPNHKGPNFYRLRFRNPSSNAASLVAIPGLERGLNDNNSRPLKINPCIVRKNSAAEIQVFAFRNPGFDAEISVSVEGLPAGITSKPATIGRNENQATILLRGNEKLESGFSRIKIIATATSGGQEITLPVAHAEITTNSVGNELAESRLTNEIVVASDSSIEFPGKIEIDQAQIDTSRGGQITAKAKLKKNPNYKGSIQQAFVYGLPRQVNRNTNTLADTGAEAAYKFDFRQDVPTGRYTAFVRGYADVSTKRCEKQFQRITDEQKRIVALQREIETEIRNATRTRQGFEQKLSQANQKANSLKSQVQNQTTLTSNAQRALTSAEKKKTDFESQITKAKANVTSLTQMESAESDPAKKKTATEKLVTAQAALTSVSQQFTVAEATLKSAETALDRQQKLLQDMKKQVASNATEIKSLQASQADAKAKEENLQADRTLGLTVKREIDSELQMARQAAQQRNRRYYVYSDPIKVSVEDVPLKLQIDRSEFRLVQGESQKVSVSIERKFGFKGDVTFQLRSTNGGTGWTLKPTPKIAANQNSVEFEVLAASNSKVGEFAGEITARLRFGNANLTKTLPISVVVLPKTKK